ncbi:hypothetical protein FRC06_001524 [Ceratobasidium sp. 370]|nr:hypothetical protein FRC06_001524 [Ceratobasidium sp. 370]
MVKRINLRRYKTNDAIQEHLDLHLTAGEALPQAVLTRIPHTPQPPVPTGSLQPYQLLDTFLLPPKSKPKSKKYSEQRGALNHIWVGNSLPGVWLEAEEDDSKAKPRRIRGSVGAATRPTTLCLVLGAPPRFRGAALPGQPDVSVGFDSIGFHQTAHDAFDTVAAQSSDEEPEPEPEPKLKKVAKLKLRLKPEPDL